MSGALPITNGELTTGNISITSQPPVKRNRTQLSCTNCRNAKLKCDRQDPCSQCVKKGRASHCIFLAQAPRRRPAVSMRTRLRHLESLVKDAMADHSPSNKVQPLLNDYQNNFGLDKSSTSQPSYQPNTKSSPEQNDIVERETDPLTDVAWSISGSTVKENAYVGAAHWAAMLADIEEVNRYFDEEQGDEPGLTNRSTPDTSLLFNLHPPATKEELLAMLPEIDIVDQLVSRFFTSNNPALHIIHRPTFQNEYARFRANPTETPVSWLSLLYAMMSCAVIATLGTGEDVLDARGNHLEVIRLYRTCCAQGLILSNYSQPGPHTIESIMIYMMGEFMLSISDPVNCYLMIAVMIRLALRLGLHRDPFKIEGNITACQGELRRRIWHTLVQIDCLTSFQIGLPSMAQSIESDTKYPRNLRDEDFDEDSAVLPEGRPETERTPVLYVICKGRLIEVLGKVATQANSLAPPSYSEVLHLDNLLEEAFSKVPSFFRVIPLELAITDSVELVIMRFSIALLYLKTRCVLHRKFLMKERENSEFAFSRRAGLAAAMELLHYQSEIYKAYQRSGRLSRDKWFIQSLSMHDFLLAATIVYLHVIQLIITGDGTISTDTQKMIAGLENSHSIWLRSILEAPESKKASDVVEMMLKKIRLALGTDSEVTMSNHEGLQTEMVSGLQISDSYPACEQAPICSQWTSTTVTGAPSIMPSNLDSMFDLPLNFDWDIFDNHLRPQQAVESASTWPEFSFDAVDY